MSPSSLVSVRSYPKRADYSKEALKSVFEASPVAHVAFLHSGKGLAGPDGDARARVLNLPLLIVLQDYVPDTEEDEDDSGIEKGELVAYFHTYGGSRLVQAVKEGLDSMTITTSKIDGLVFSPTPHNHSVNYRSACIYGYEPKIIPNTPSGSKEKRRVLDGVVNTITGYDRIGVVGGQDETQLRQTVVIRVRIEDASCKQRTGSYKAGEAPDEGQAEEGQAFTGTVPCWTHYGDLRGTGHGRETVEQVLSQRNVQSSQYAEQVMMAQVPRS